MNEELRNVGSFIGEQGKRYELYISKCDGLLHIYNNVEQEEELHVVVRVEETSAGIDATLISGCDKTQWENLKKRLISILSLHAPAVINCHFGFKFKNLWDMWYSSYPGKGSSYQKH